MSARITSRTLERGARPGSSFLHCRFAGCFLCCSGVYFELLGFGWANLVSCDFLQTLLPEVGRLNLLSFEVKLKSSTAVLPSAARLDVAPSRCWEPFSASQLAHAHNTVVALTHPLPQQTALHVKKIASGPTQYVAVGAL